MLPGYTPVPFAGGVDTFTKVLLHFDGDTVDWSGAKPPHSFVFGSGGAVIGHAPDGITPKFGSGAFAPGGSGVCYALHAADLNPGPPNLTGDFTLECWVISGTVGASQGIIAKCAPNGFGTYMIYQAGGNYVFYCSSNGSAWDISNGQIIGAAAAGVWSHLAVSRQGATWRLFKNGVLTTTFSNSSAVFLNTQPFVVGNHGLGGAALFDGWVDEVRFSNGVARYTAAFTPAAAPFPSKTLPVGGNDDYTRTLMHFDGPNGQTTTVDSALCGNPKPWTLANGAIISNGNYLFGGASMICQNPAANQNCFTTNVDDFTVANMDFTIDCWFNTYSGDSTRRFIWGQCDNTAAASTIQTICEIQANNLLRATVCQAGSVSTAVVGHTPIALNTWYHIAFVRSGGNLILFLNGATEGSIAISGPANNPGTLFSIGMLGAYGLSFFGYIEEFRYSVGIARWTANFTPPTVAYGP